MFWYIMICILMLYPYILVYVGKTSEKKTQCVALMIACFILWFFMAMRSTAVGVDTKYYSYVFTQFADIPIGKVFSAVTYATDSETWAFDFEPGYRLINKIVSWFSASPQAITIVNSTLIIILLYYFVRKQSPNFLLSIWLYITLGIYQTEMNVTRNAIAIFIVYNALHYVKNHQFGKYILFCLAASTIHIAALVFIPVYWLVNYFHITPKRAIIILLAACIFGMIFPVISPYITLILPDSLDRYFNGNLLKWEMLLVGVLHAGVFLVSYLLLKKSERKLVSSVFSVGTMMFLINLCLFGLNIGLNDAARMAALFGPYIIVFIPQVLSLIKSNSKRNYATTIIVILCGCQYILRLFINNIGGTMPYRFFW